MCYHTIEAGCQKILVLQREFFLFDLYVRNMKVQYLNKALGRPAGKDVLTFPEDAPASVLEAMETEFEETGLIVKDQFR